MKDSIIFCPKGLCENKWSDVKEFLSKIAFAKESEISRECLPLVVSSMRELLSLLEEKVDLTLENAGGGFKFKAETFDLECERKLVRNLNGVAESIYNGLGAVDNKLFNMDGPYPYYTQQPLRILFVGREACWMGGRNYIQTLLGDLKNGKVGEWSIDQYPFHKRQFYMAYGILAAAQATGSFPDWEKVPWASDLGKILFARNQRNDEANKEAVIKPDNDLTNMSWAFMNLSKLSNDTGDWRTDDRRYRPFVENNKDYIIEEIALLRPDVIIGANVYDLIDILGYNNKPDVSEPACYYYEAQKSKVCGNWKLPPFLNCYHFSAIKSDQGCFYDAVKRVLSLDYRLEKIIANHQKWGEEHSSEILRCACCQ